MSNSLYANDEFYQSIFEIDFNFFKELKAKGCRFCKGPLDTANYLRKPRGGMNEKFSLRFGLCCRKCRRRHSPPSLRFLGRKVYVAWIVILYLDFCEKLGLNKAIHRRTIFRWYQYWMDRLKESSVFMRKVRGILPVGTPSAETPEGLIIYLPFLDSTCSWHSLLNFFKEPD